MDFCHDQDLSCVFSGECPALCNARKLMARTKIKLGVTGAANNKVVYLCAPPMLVLALAKMVTCCLKILKLFEYKLL